MCSSRPLVLLRIARSAKFESQSLLFVSILSLLSQDYFLWFVTCSYGRTQSKLPASASHAQRGEWAAFTLSCAHSFGLILNMSGSKTENKKGQVVHALYLCVTHRCCFFQSKRLIYKNK